MTGFSPSGINRFLIIEFQIRKGFRELIHSISYYCINALLTFSSTCLMAFTNSKIKQDNVIRTQRSNNWTKENEANLVTGANFEMGKR
jgi:hypothetical protein